MQVKQSEPPVIRTKCQADWLGAAFPKLPLNTQIRFGPRIYTETRLITALRQITGHSGQLTYHQFGMPFTRLLVCLSHLIIPLCSSSLPINQGLGLPSVTQGHVCPVNHSSSSPQLWFQFRCWNVCGRPERQLATVTCQTHRSQRETKIKFVVVWAGAGAQRRITDQFLDSMSTINVVHPISVTLWLILLCTMRLINVVCLCVL